MLSLVPRLAASRSVLGLLGPRGLTHQHHLASQFSSSSSTSNQGQQEAGARGQEKAHDEKAETSGRHANEELQQRLLDAALGHVKSKGWSHAALVAAARDLGLSPAATGVLPRREGQLVEHFMQQCNANMEKELAERREELMAQRLSQRVTHAVKFRLQQYVPVLDSWPQALAIAASPSNFPHSAKLLAQTVDSIWYAVGDQSTDMSWYTKRATLAAIYLSTELYMLTDPSPNFSDTWDALERRLHDSFVLGKAFKSATAGLESWVHAAAAAAASAKGP